MVLAAGTGVQTSQAVAFSGLAVLAPTLRDRYDLSLTQIGVLLGGASVGAVLTLLPWGLLADRIGERTTATVGLLGAAAGLAGAAYAPDFASLVLRPPGVHNAGQAPDEPALKALGDAMADDTGYTSEYGYQLYDTSGTTEDWNYGAAGTFGYTIEMGPGSSQGGNFQFQVDVTDNGELGSGGSVPADSYATRVWNASGTYYVVGSYGPNNTSTTNTGQVPIVGGNIRVKP